MKKNYCCECAQECSIDCFSDYSKQQNRVVYICRSCVEEIKSKYKIDAYWDLIRVHEERQLKSIDLV